MKLLVQAILGLTFVAATSATPTPAQSKGQIRHVKRDGVTSTVYNHLSTRSQLEFVSDSGICETTPNVRQHSGYLKAADERDANMWFWFFEARSNASTAPLAVWLNGGPGCSSMSGLFKANGPCRFKDNSSAEPELNPHSWNNYANMLYIDQPIGTGFSHGNVSLTNSTAAAAPYLWNFLQSFYDLFPEYENREFGIFTESYGGHYGPEFTTYFAKQNKAIDAGNLTGHKINMTALGIGNGWIDPLIQYGAFPNYSANNQYNKILNSSEEWAYNYFFETNCAPYVELCYATNNASVCSAAQASCFTGVQSAILYSHDFGVYDVRQPANDPNPPRNYIKWINQPDVKKAIGATGDYEECGMEVYNEFLLTGDSTKSYTKQIGEIVDSGVQTTLFAGDADWLCNYFGIEEIANSVNFTNADAFRSSELKPYTVNGKERGLFKSAGNFNYLRVYEAGHMVPYYQPEVSLQMFVQAMQNKPLSST